jgi:hypothetical protein
MPIILGSGSQKPEPTEPERDRPEGGQGGEKPKLIVESVKADESWKDKARKEKEKLAKDLEAAEEARGPEHELPPASFLGILEELAVRAMMALGQMRHPAAQDLYIDLESARYTIDLLDIVKTKTKGNLTPEEDKTLTDLLHNLRLTFVHVQRQVSSAMAQEALQAAQRAQEKGPGKDAEKGGAGGGEQKPPPKIIL